MAPLKGSLLLLAVLTSSTVAQYNPYDSDALFTRELVYELLRREPGLFGSGSAKVHPAPATKPEAQSSTQLGALPAVQGAVQGATQGAAPTKLGMLDRARIKMNKMGRTQTQKNAALDHPEYDTALHGKTYADRQKARQDFIRNKGVSQLSLWGEETKDRQNAEWLARNSNTVKAAEGKHTIHVHKTDKLNTGLNIAKTVTGAAVALKPRDFDDDFYGDYGLLDARDLYGEDLYGDYGLLDARDLYDDDEEFIWV